MGHRHHLRAPGKGWLYLVAIIDWFSRYVLSRELDDSRELGFVLDAVAQVFVKAKPDILNSDHKAANSPALAISSSSTALGY